MFQQCMLCYREGTEIEWRYDEEGEEVRVSLRTGAIIPIPYGAEAIDDFIDPTNYAGNERWSLFCQLRGKRV